MLTKNPRNILAIICGVFLIVPIAACYKVPFWNMSKDASTYNITIEDAQNQMLFLNIVRASKRQPMYFSTVQQLQANNQLTYGTGDSSVTIPFGALHGGAATYNSLAFGIPKASFTVNPTLSIAALDTKEFMNGILKAVPIDILEYYWTQGWSRRMLLNLFVASIRYPPSKDDPAGRIIKNSFYQPKDKQEKFFEEVRKYSQCELISSNPTISTVAPVNIQKFITDVSGDKQVQIADKIGLSYEAANKNEQVLLKLKKREYSFVCEDDKSAKVRVSSYDAAEKDSLILTIRSPEAMLYYLGEIVRFIDKEGSWAMVPLINIPECENEGGKEVPLFVAGEKKILEKKEIIGNSFVSVKYDEKDYIIPRLVQYDKHETDCQANNSIHVLSLVSLLIRKQITASELPSTPASVNVVAH